MWGIIPAAGAGSRIQPLAFSKELLPVGSRFDGETERPRVQKLGSACPLAGVFGRKPEIDGPRNPEERFPIRLRNQPCANGGQRAHLMRIEELACGTGGRHGHSILAHKRFFAHQCDTPR